MNNDLDWQKERNKLLKEQLSKMSKYELARLRKCFEYEYIFHPENKDDIDNIIEYIDLTLESKQ